MKESLGSLFVDFGVEAHWRPSAGGPSQVARVILDSPERIVGMAIVNEYEMQYVGGDLIGLDHDELITIIGVNFSVRGAPSSTDDGVMKVATLTKR